MMRPYATIRLTEFPDVADMRNEARRSRVGMLSRHTVNDRPTVKHRLRRAMKRSDRRRSLSEELAIEREAERALAQELDDVYAEYFA